MTGTDRLSASLADRYRVERELGAGGMATVYLAHDMRHDRKVAIKVLKPELAAVIGGERFVLEIKTTAQLQHPHILPLFDSGQVDGVPYYVMPYVEGETLRGRLDRETQLSVEEAVRLTTQVADALDYAHRRGVIHRDIKPENILLHDGRAIVVDFGIALAVSAASGGRLTKTGVSIGTPHYMSPEQAAADKEITGRSDIYSLGCVLHEMLAGEPPHLGHSAQQIIMKVIAEEVEPVTKRRKTVPAHVAAAVARALEKIPADRFATAAEFAAALRDPPTASGGHREILHSPPASLRSWHGGRVVQVSLGAAILLAILASWRWSRPRPPEQVIRYSMGIPPEQAMRQELIGVNLAFSPDGMRIVYLGPGERDAMLWLRDRDRLDATPLAGTANGGNPTFSPDGTRIAYSSGDNNALMVIPATGGPPITLAVGGPGSGGGLCWGPDRWIYFDSERGLSRVPEGGGDVELVVPLESALGEVGVAWPDVLPNGKGLVFRSRRGRDPADFELVAFDLRSHTRRILTKGLMARYVAPGYLVFVRADGAVLAAPFDQDELRFTGPTVPLFEGVKTKGLGTADLAISRSGTLAYVPGSSTTGPVVELVTIDRNGRSTPLSPRVTYSPTDGVYALSLSPEGRRLALDVATQALSDIWILELPTGTFSRLTFNRGFAIHPQWTPDGRAVIYSVLAQDDLTLWRRRADGRTPAERIAGGPGHGIYGASISRDGRWLVYVTDADSDRSTVYGLRLGQDTLPVPLLAEPYHHDGVALSPDGRWMAYSSNESGRPEIYVRPFPRTADGKWQVSTAGGQAPRWAHSGKELFFEGTNGDLMVAAVRPGPGFASEGPRRLFPLPTASRGVPFYDILPGDQRFITARPARVELPPGAGQLVVVDHWTTELRARMQDR